MARNIEIKARLERLDVVREIAGDMSGGLPVEIVQEDIFFECANGRMKLRCLSATEGELIFYRRPDRFGPKESFYHVYHTNAPQELRENLALAYGEIGRVVKCRTLYMVGRTRIHLDHVEGLGDFLELEVVLSDGEKPEEGQREASGLLVKLGISEQQLINVAYVDLLKKV